MANKYLNVAKQVFEAPFIFPTLMRQKMEENPCTIEQEAGAVESNLEKIAWNSMHTLVSTVNITAIGALTTALSNQSSNPYSPLILLPAATNLLSGIYETGRILVKNFVSKTI